MDRPDENYARIFKEKRESVYQKLISPYSGCYGTPADHQYAKHIYSYIIQWLMVTPHIFKFFLPQFFEILENSAKRLKKISPTNIAKSFMSVGQYAKHLLDQPWKKEYQAFKTYGGFFQIHIDSYLADAISIFELMGYRHIKTQSTLVLEGEINHEAVMKVYFCCFVASCEMDIVQDISDKLSIYGSYNIQDVMRCRKETYGNVDVSVEWIIRNCKPSNDPIEGTYKNFVYKPNNVENITKTDASERKLPRIINKYGNDGVKRKGPPEGRQLFSKALREDFKNDDLKYVQDPVLEGFDVILNSTENNSDEDLYEPADLDEHMERSLNILKAESDAIVNIPPDNYPQGGASEWDFVRDKLEQDFGDEYYVGERGDLTKMAPFKSCYSKGQNEIHIKSKPAKQITVNLTPSPEEEPLAVDCPSSAVSATDMATSALPQPTDLHKVLTTKHEIKAADQDSSFQHCDKGLVAKPLEDLTRSSVSKGYYSLQTKTQYSQTPTELKEGNWQCQSCTLSNEAANLVCTACDKSREVVKTPTLTSGGPECPKCTLVNRRGADKCEVCDTPLAGSPTYI